MWKGARGVRGTNSSPRSPRLKPDKNVQNFPMDEDPLCSDGPIDIMLKPKPGLVPHFSCTFRPLQEAVLRHSPQGSPQNSPRHPHSPRSRCDTPLCPSPTRSHSSMIPNAPLLIRPRAYAHRSRSRSWDDTRDSRTAPFDDTVGCRHPHPRTRADTMIPYNPIPDYTTPYRPSVAVRPSADLQVDCVLVDSAGLRPMRLYRPQAVGVVV
jgi:hypothetical protein